MPQAPSPEPSALNPTPTLILSDSLLTGNGWPCIDLHGSVIDVSYHVWVLACGSGVKVWFVRGVGGFTWILCPKNAAPAPQDQALQKPAHDNAQAFKTRNPGFVPLRSYPRKTFLRHGHPSPKPRATHSFQGPLNAAGTNPKDPNVDGENLAPLRAP